MCVDIDALLYSSSCVLSLISQNMWGGPWVSPSLYETLSVHVSTIVNMYMYMYIWVVEYQPRNLILNLQGIPAGVL